MFDLIVNNESVFLPDDFSFGLVRENPLFNERGDFSYPFTVPYEPNKHIFQYAGEIDSVIPRGITLPFRLEWCGNTELQGEISSWKVRGNEIEFNLTGGKTLFFSKLKDLYMDETPIGTDSNESTSDAQRAKWSNSLWKDARTSPYVFAPVLLPNFFEDGSSDSYWHPKKVVNLWDFETDKLADSVGHYQTNTLVMHLYLKFVLEKIANLAGYRIRRNDLDDYSDFNKAYIVSMNKLWNTWSIQYHRCLPHILITDFLDAMEAWIHLHIVPDDKNKVVDLVLMKKVLEDPNVNTSFNDRVLLKEPETESSEKKAFKFSYKLEGDDFELAGAEIDANYIQNIASKSELPAASIIYENNVRFVTSTERNFKCNKYPPTTEEGDPVYKWELVGELRPHSDLDEDPEKVEVELEVLPSKIDVVEYDIPNLPEDPGPEEPEQPQDPDPVTRLTGTLDVELPFSSRKGNDLYKVKYNSVPYNEFPLMLLFYRGWKTYTTHDFHTNKDIDLDFPVSSYDCFDIDETANGNLSLKWHGSKGIYRLFQEIVAHWEKTRKRPFQKYLDLTPSELFSLSSLEKYQLEDFPFLIDKIHIDLSRDKIESIRLELFTV